MMSMESDHIDVISDQGSPMSDHRMHSPGGRDSDPGSPERPNSLGPDSPRSISSGHDDGRMGQQSPSPPLIQQPIRLTNFFIEEILKPDFGRKIERKCDKLEGIVQDLRNRNTSNALHVGNHYTKNNTLQNTDKNVSDKKNKKKDPILWPAWVYCTRYSDRPSSGPRSRKLKKKDKTPDEKRPRTAFTNEQLQKLKKEFEENRYLTEQRRQDLAGELKLNESQIKIWFQNKRAKIKKTTGHRNGLAVQLMAQGLYNHSTSGPGED